MEKRVFAIGVKTLVVVVYNQVSLRSKNPWQLAPPKMTTLPG